jgi:hypothetical protein
MTPAGRRALRLRLMSFWSRPEESDKKELEAAGIPVGAAEAIELTGTEEEVEKTPKVGSPG